MQTGFRGTLRAVAIIAVAACGGSYPAAAAPAPVTETTAAPGPVAPLPVEVADSGDKPPAKKPSKGPVGQRAQGLREAADLLDKAQSALDNGNKDLAEMLFSSAELLTGEDAVAAVAPAFREGAPPRVTTAPVKVEDKGAQPKAVGNSDDDEPDAKPARGKLVGAVKIDGKSAAGVLGFVTLEPIGKKPKGRAPKQRVMEQRNREFAPHVLAVPVGSTVTFPNFDSIFHNVFSRSDASMFDLGLYKGGEARDVKFEREGIVRLGCNLHANMSAYVIVVAAPHYAITGDDGSFTFKSLDPGKYTLKAWSEKSKAPITQVVTVKAGDNTVEVGVAGDAPAGPSPDKFGAARGQAH
jgi:plastocyanin